MKNIKFMFLIIFIFILCGCSVNSEVEVLESGKVKEKVIFDVPTDNMTDSEFQKYANNVLKNYDSALNTRNYKNESIYENNVGKIIIYNSYNNICEYVENTIFSQYIYEHISCTQTDDYYEIKSETKHIDYCPDCTSWPALDSVKLNIKLPMQAFDNNANTVNLNTYVWKYDENTKEDKNLYLKISKDDLKTSDRKVKTYKKVSSIFEKFLVILAIALLIFAFYVVFNKLYKKYKSNKLNY